jgi:hypothetical protein
MFLVTQKRGNNGMNQRPFGIFSRKALLSAIVIGSGGAVHAHEASAPYATMAPLSQYLMIDQNAEATLARSAAPASVSRDATVMVLKQHGYETVAKGKNGFVCIVERSWMSPFDSPEFWNPKNRSPTCFNPAAVRSVLPFSIKRTEMVVAGMPKTRIIARIREAIEHKELPALEPGAMCYMMSKDMYLGDSQGHWHPHLMFYSPKSDGADWGANLEGSPVFLDPVSLSKNSPDPFITLMVPVWMWSDETPAPRN